MRYLNKIFKHLLKITWTDSFPCKWSSDNADLQTHAQTLCLKRATNLGNFCVY